MAKHSSNKCFIFYSVCNDSMLAMLLLQCCTSQNNVYKFHWIFKWISQTNNALNYTYRIRHRSFAVLHINEFSSFSRWVSFFVIIWFRRLLFYSYSFHMFILYISLEFKCLYAIRYTFLSLIKCIKWLLRLMIRCWFCWLSARHWIVFQYLILV